MKNERFEKAVEKLSYFWTAIPIHRTSESEIKIGEYRVYLDPISQQWLVWETRDPAKHILQETAEDPVDAICHALSLAIPEVFEELCEADEQPIHRS